MEHIRAQSSFDNHPLISEPLLSVKSQGLSVKESRSFNILQTSQHVHVNFIHTGSQLNLDK